MRRPRLGVGLLVTAGCAGVLSACGGARARAGANGHAPAITYDVSIDAALETADVRVCFDEPPEGWLAPRSPEDVTRVRRAEIVGRGGAHPLETEARGAPLDDLADGDCLRLVIALTGAEPFWARRLRDLDERVAEPSSFLWAPSAGHDARMELTLRLPAGVHASVPWPHIGGGRYRLDGTALRWRSFVAFGRFTVDHVDLPDGHAMEIARLGGEMRASPEGIRRWLIASWRAAASLLGRLPQTIQVLLVPSGGRGGGAVSFGATGRGGGAGVILFPSADAADEALLGDWVAPHELTHFAIPVVPDADAWMSEGFVTYYTEVLRARVGLQTPEVSWATLARGCARGRAGVEDAPLVQSSAAMHETHSYQRVYWGGAGLALTADVEIRRATHGRASLDSALREISARAANRRVLPAFQLLSTVTPGAGGDVLRRVVAAAAGASALPAIDAVLRRLGVRPAADGTVTFDPDAPDASIREAITARGDAPAP